MYFKEDLFMRTNIRKVVAFALIGAMTLSGFRVSSSNVSAKVKLNKTKLTMSVGKSFKLSVKGTKSKVKWTSSKTKVVSVTKGKIKAKKVGKAVITAKFKSKKLTCKVTVTKNTPSTNKPAVNPTAAPTSATKPTNTPFNNPTSTPISIPDAGTFCDNNNLSWSVTGNEDNLTLLIKDDDNAQDFYDEKTDSYRCPWLAYTASIINVKIDAKISGSMACWFQNFYNLKCIDFSNIDTSNVTHMYDAFYGA